MMGANRHIEPRMNRRQFLVRTSAATIGVCLVPLGCESNLVEPITFGRALPFLTPNDAFFVKVGAEISIGNWQQPRITNDEWALTIDGLGGSPQTIEYADLEAEASSGNELSILKTMRCVIDSNEVGGLIGTAVWRGIPLTRFVAPGTLDSAARRLRIYGSDGFTNNITVDRLAGDASSQLVPPLLVTHMNGEPLSQEHGGPVRLLLNEAFGFKNVKWIHRIEITDNDAAFGTYQDAGFADDGVIRVASRATNPIQNAIVPPGPLRLSGFALSGFGPIERVDVAIDGGDFVAAGTRSIDDIAGTDPLVTSTMQVIDGLSYPYRAVWTQWFMDVELAPGRHSISVRARDTTGAEQPVVDQDITDGINAIATIDIEVV